jgi:hypothetical protein
MTSSYGQSRVDAARWSVLTVASTLDSAYLRPSLTPPGSAPMRRHPILTAWAIGEPGADGAGSRPRSQWRRHPAPRSPGPGWRPAPVAASARSAPPGPAGPAPPRPPGRAAGPPAAGSRRRTAPAAPSPATRPGRAGRADPPARRYRRSLAAVSQHHRQIDQHLPRVIALRRAGAPQQRGPGVRHNPVPSVVTTGHARPHYPSRRRRLSPARP